MDISCNIIKDLLPLYAEDLTSQDSKRLVDDHLCGCLNCRSELNVIRSESQLPPLETDVKSLKRVGNSIRRRRVLSVLAAVMTLITVFASVCVYLFTPYYLTSEEAIEDVYLKEDGGLAIYYARGVIGISGWAQGENNWGILCHTTRYDWYKGRMVDAKLASYSDAELEAYLASKFQMEQFSERYLNSFFNIMEDHGTIRTEEGEIVHGYVADLMQNEKGEWIYKPADRNHWYINPQNGDVEVLLWDAKQPYPDKVFFVPGNDCAIVFGFALVMALVLGFSVKFMGGIGRELTIRGVMLFGSFAISVLFVTGGKLVTIWLSSWKDFIVLETVLLTITAILWHQIWRYRKADKMI